MVPTVTPQLVGNDGLHALRLAIRGSIVMAAVLLVAACSPNPYAPPYGTPYRVSISRSPPPPSVSIKPATAAEITVTAQAFLRAISAYNRAIEAADKRRGGDRSYDAVTIYYADLARAEAAFKKALDGIAFPAEFADEAKTLADAVLVAQQRDRRAARARDPEDLVNLSIQAKTAEKHAADAAAVLREALGLPPVP